MGPMLVAQAAFAAGVMLFAGGFYAAQTYNHYSGSLTAKLAAETSAKCDALKGTNASAYTNCQEELQSQMAILAETGEMKVEDCDVAGSRVYCWVRVWMVPQRLETTRAALAKLRARQYNTDSLPTTTTTASTPTTSFFGFNNNLF